MSGAPVLLVGVLLVAPAEAGAEGAAGEGLEFVALPGEPAVWIATREVSTGLFDAVTGRNGPASRNPTAPAAEISWDGAVQFCNQLSTRDHLRPAYRIRERLPLGGSLAPGVELDPSADGYRLPTEAEWERAIGVPAVRNLAGGVWEWVFDRSAGGTLPALPPNAGLFHVVRGGSASLPRAQAGVAARGWLPSSFEDETVGVRLARGVTGEAPPPPAPRKRRSQPPPKR